LSYASPLSQVWIYLYSNVLKCKDFLSDRRSLALNLIHHNRRGHGRI